MTMHCDVTGGACELPRCQHYPCVLYAAGVTKAMVQKPVVEMVKEFAEMTCLVCGTRYKYGERHGCAQRTDTAVANPKQRFGDAKPSLSFVPLPARVYAALALRNGAGKYGRANWRETSVEVMTYIDALERHVCAWVEGEDVAPDTGIPHLGHALASLCILVDAIENKKAIDNRPKCGDATVIDRYSTTKPLRMDWANPTVDRRVRLRRTKAPDFVSHEYGRRKGD